MRICNKASAFPHMAHKAEMSIFAIKPAKLTFMDKQGKILVVDDNEDVLFALNLLLEPYMEKIKVAKDPQRIEQFLKDFNPDVILLDMNFRQNTMSGQEGFHWLEKILAADPQAVVIFMTAYSDTEKAVRAIKAGATDFIAKPWEKEKLLATVLSGIKLRKSRLEADSLREKVAAMQDYAAGATDMIGESAAMDEVFDTVGKVAGTDANVLVLGENGTGKDLIARMLHQSSPRCRRGFVHIDLGSIPEQLFESELFGYEKGAFTDAKGSKAGRIELADGGTLFLDEIGNLTLPMQAKLLAVLQNRCISRLGGTREIPLDIRLICATNANLARMVEQGEFRQDLYYRINTIEINVPPLRERGNDITLLAKHFLKEYSHKYRKKVPLLTREAANKLQKYPWPGNVRELQHVMERAVIMGNGFSIHPSDIILKAPVQKGSGAFAGGSTGGGWAGGSGWAGEGVMNLEQLEQQAIERAMEVSNGNISEAARLLGITRFALYRRLEKLGM